MLVGISFGLPRQSRELKAESAQIESENKAASGTVRSSCFYFKRKDGGKELDGLAALKKFQGAWKAALEKYARFPFASGTKLLPAACVEQFVKADQSFKDKVDEVWMQWADDEYPQWLATAPERMGGLFDPQDFPALSDCKERFICDVTMAPLGNAEQVQRISLLSPDMKELMEQATNDAFAKGVAESNKKNWQDIMTPLKHLVATLEKPKKVIRDTLIGNIISIVEMLPQVNLSGDPQLAELAEKAKAGLCKLTPEDLRKSTDTQNEAIKVAKALVAEFDPFARKFGVE